MHVFYYFFYIINLYFISGRLVNVPTKNVLENGGLSLSLSLSCRRVLAFPSNAFILRCHNMVVVLGSWSPEIGFLN
jgi:hypothetical protein